MARKKAVKNKQIVCKKTFVLACDGGLMKLDSRPGGALIAGMFGVITEGSIVHCLLY